MVERYNQTLKNMLTKVTVNRKTQWSKFIDTCVFAYNTSEQESTKYSPFELMFGRRATLPIDIDVDRNDPNALVDSAASLSTSALSSLTARRKQLLEKAKENILKAQERQKSDYDRRRANPKVYIVGAKVLKKDFLRKKRKGGGMDEKYIGPYVITRHLGKGLYALRLVANPAVTVEKINGAHLKPFKAPNHTGDRDSSDHAPPSIHQSHGPIDDRDSSDHTPPSIHQSHGPIDDRDSSDHAPPSIHQSHGPKQDSDTLDETVPSLFPPMPPLELLSEMTRPSPSPITTLVSNLNVSVADTGFIQQEDSLSESLCQVCASIGHGIHAVV